MAFLAMPVKRIRIDKESGKKRPIGIPVLEDRIVQRAVATILDAVYAADFHDFPTDFGKGKISIKRCAK